MQKMKLESEPLYEAKYTAYEYQREAVNALKDLEYGAIFHEQGLGKTKIAIDILLYWLNKRMVDVVLIVTKKQLVANWVGEFKEHTGLKPAILTSNKADNYYVFNVYWTGRDLYGDVFNPQCSAKATGIPLSKGRCLNWLNEKVMPSLV